MLLPLRSKLLHLEVLLSITSMELPSLSLTKVDASLAHLDVRVLNQLLSLGLPLVPNILESLGTPPSLPVTPQLRSSTLPLPPEILSAISSALDVTPSDVLLFWRHHHRDLLSTWTASLHARVPPDPRADDRLLMANAICMFDQNVFVLSYVLVLIYVLCSPGPETLCPPVSTCLVSSCLKPHLIYKPAIKATLYTLERGAVSVLCPSLYCRGALSGSSLSCRLHMLNRSSSLSYTLLPQLLRDLCISERLKACLLLRYTLCN